MFDTLHVCRKISRRDGLSSYDVVYDPPACSCGHFLSMGLPCRHYLCLVNGLFKDKIPLAAFHVRWTLEKAIEVPTFVVCEDFVDEHLEQDAAGRSSLFPQNSYNARQQEFKEVNRLFGDRLQPWLDVCLSGKKIVDFPLPVVQSDCSPLSDPAPSGSWKRNEARVTRKSQRTTGLTSPRRRASQESRQTKEHFPQTTESNAG